jgi:beta-N-acetylhexosaminidase
MLPVCNSPEAVGELLARWRVEADPLRSARIARLFRTVDAPAADRDLHYRAGIDACAALQQGV